MIAVEVDGVRVECADEKAARKAVRDAAKRAAQADEQRRANSLAARLRACEKAYNVLSRKARGQTFPRAWRLYEPHDKWAKNLYVPEPVDYGYGCKHRLQFHDGAAVLDHYGMEMVGVVCGGAGWSFAVVLRDKTTRQEAVYAVDAQGGCISMVECYGVSAADFKAVDGDDD